MCVFVCVIHDTPRIKTLMSTFEKMNQSRFLFYGQHVSMYSHYLEQSMDQPCKVANPARGQLNGKKLYCRPAPACSFSKLRLNLVLTGLLPLSAAASIYLFIPPTAIGSVPSLSGHVTACRWRSLPRVCRHRFNSPQGSSSNECCLFRFRHGPIN